MLVSIVGATGTGKSELSLALGDALDMPVEVVNADAMQLYRGMDVGTAKLSIDERRGIRHHMLDVLDVTDEATVAAYQPAARAAIEQIERRGAMPVLVGGSGLYVSSVVFDFSFPGTDAAVRARLEAELDSLGVGVLAARLARLDPPAAAAIGSQNPRRVIRALEVIEITGEPLRHGLPDEQTRWRPVVTIGLAADRAVLVERLDRRVERMWRNGLVDEVESLLPSGLRDGVTASRAIGYTQAIAQLDGAMTEAEAIAETQALTRRYSRRQGSWFRRNAETVWLPHDAPDLVALAAQVVRSTIDA